MMMLVLPFSMTIYSFLNMANWMTYELTGKHKNIKRNLITIYTLYRLHFSCYPFFPSSRHSCPQNFVLLFANFACQRVHQFEGRFFENGVEDTSWTCNVWDYGGFD